MGWNPLLIDVADVPVVNFDVNAVANEADIMRDASAKFADQAQALTRSWGGLADSYITGHTELVASKMDDAKASAARAEWVYEHVAWTLGEFVAEIRDLRDQADALEAAVRELVRWPSAKFNVLVSGTPDFEKNVAYWRDANRIHGAIRHAMGKCKTRLDTIGEDPNAYDPYDGVTSVTRDGSAFTSYVDVEAKPLDWPFKGRSGVISGSQVDQGSLQNCWFMSSLAALADKDPHAIERMVRKNGDGTYTVTLFVEGQWQSIPVDNDMLLRDNGSPRFAGNGENNDQALWPLLVEKAAIIAYGGDYAALAAGTGAMSMTLFTGNSASTDIITPNDLFNEDAIARYSEQSRRDDVIMTANSNISPDMDGFDIPVTRTREDPRGEGTETIPDTAEFRNNHVYQVANIDPNGNVTLVDPNNIYGIEDGLDHDRFTITPERFHDLFMGISIGST